MIIDFCMKDGETDLVDLRKIAQMGEAVVYMPYIISKDKNRSSEMSDVMNDKTPLSASFYEKNWVVGRPKSRTQVSALVSLLNDEEQKQINHNKNLEVICFTIQQKFESLPSAFKYFDQQNRKKITIRDFNTQLNKLHVQMPIGDIIQCFSYADTTKQGYIDIHAFKSLYYYKPHLLTTTT